MRFQKHYSPAAAGSGHTTSSTAQHISEHEAAAGVDHSLGPEVPASDLSLAEPDGEPAKSVGCVNELTHDQGRTLLMHRQQLEAGSCVLLRLDHRHRIVANVRINEVEAKGVEPNHDVCSSRRPGYSLFAHNAPVYYHQLQAACLSCLHLWHVGSL
jgi:hypothetical protein